MCEIPTCPAVPVQMWQSEMICEDAQYTYSLEMYHEGRINEINNEQLLFLFIMTFYLIYMNIQYNL